MDRKLTPQQIEARLAAHDDYMGAIQTMQQRQKQMAPLAHRGDVFARGYLAALAEFGLAIQAELARRIS